MKNAVGHNIYFKGSSNTMIERADHIFLAASEEKTADRAGQPGPDVRPAPAPASLMGAAVSLAASLARFAASGFKIVAEPLHELRMGHCRACEYRHDTQCSLCRCFVAKKAWLPHEDCPIGRWTT